MWGLQHTVPIFIVLNTSPWPYNTPQNLVSKEVRTRYHKGQPTLLPIPRRLRTLVSFFIGLCQHDNLSSTLPVVALNWRQEELKTVCKHFLNKASPDTVSVTTVDRLGLDLRVKARDLTDEFRIGFRQPVRFGLQRALVNSSLSGNTSSYYVDQNGMPLFTSKMKTIYQYNTWAVPIPTWVM